MLLDLGGALVVDGGLDVLELRVQIGQDILELSDFVRQLGHELLVRLVLLGLGVKLLRQRVNLAEDDLTGRFEVLLSVVGSFFERVSDAFLQVLTKISQKNCNFELTKKVFKNLSKLGP